MFDPLLVIHSLTRWLVLAAAVAATARAVLDWRRGRDWTPAGARAGRVFVILMDIQLLLGILLYVVSPTVRAALGDMGAAMGDPALRFWSVEHAAMMLIAVALAHAGRVLSLKAKDPAARHKRAAICFGLALVVMLTAVPWPFRPDVGRPWLPWGGS